MNMISITAGCVRYLCLTRAGVDTSSSRDSCWCAADMMQPVLAMLKQSDFFSGVRLYRNCLVVISHRVNRKSSLRHTAHLKGVSSNQPNKKYISHFACLNTHTQRHSHIYCVYMECFISSVNRQSHVCLVPVGKWKREGIYMQINAIT